MYNDGMTERFSSCSDECVGADNFTLVGQVGFESWPYQWCITSIYITNCLSA